MSLDKQTLLPCPFCGDIESLDAAEALGQHIDGCPTIAAGCENCGAVGPSVSYTGGKQIPIPTPDELLERSAQRWNARPASPVTRSAEALRYAEKAFVLIKNLANDEHMSKARNLALVWLSLYEDIEQLEASQPIEADDKVRALASKMLCMAKKAIDDANGEDLVVITSRQFQAFSSQPQPQSDEGLRYQFECLRRVLDPETLTALQRYPMDVSVAHAVEAIISQALSRQAPVPTTNGGKG